MKLVKLAVLLLLWQGFIILVSKYSLSWIPLRSGDYLGSYQQGYLISPLYYSRANFDGNHYISIARDGYGISSHYAFFPLYPLLVRLLSNIIHPDYTAAFGLSLCAFAIALAVLWRLIRLDYSGAVASWAILLLVFFPVSFFFSFIYTESLFLLFVVSAFYSARLGRWWLAGILGLLAASTRLMGIALFPALALEYFIQSPRPKIKISRLLPLLLIPAGLGIYMGYLQLVAHDPLAFMHVQENFRQGRSAHFVLIFQVFWRYLKMIFTVNRADPIYLAVLLEFGSALVFSFAAVVSLFRQRLSYAIYSLICIFLPPLTGNFISMSRFALVAFPLFILLGQTIAKSSWIAKLFALVVLVFLSVVYISLFVRGIWVA